MTSLRLVGRPAAAIDLALLRSAARLVRSDGTLWVQAPEGLALELRRDLALAGLGARDDDAPAPGPGLLPTLGLDLIPATVPALEVLTLRRLPLAEAISRSLGRRWLRRAVPSYRAARESRCRELLRGADELAWWERRAWLTHDALRDACGRRSFRPILFDRAALVGPRPGGLVHGRDGVLTRWAFG
jgi:hypothetical protein